MTEALRPKHTYKFDVAIIIGILVVALIGFGVVRCQRASTADTQAALVHVEGPDGLVVDLPLAEDTRYEVTTELGTNTLVIQGGTVHIEDADCPDKLCQRQGTIDTVGQTLICLPHRLFVSITASDGSGGVGDGQSADHDLVSR